MFKAVRTLQQTFRNQSFVVGVSKYFSSIKTSNSSKRNDAAYFMTTWNTVSRDLLEFIGNHDHLHLATSYYKKALDYNVVNGQKTVGLLTVQAFNQLADNPSDEDVQLAHILAWANELFHGASNVIDDVIDGGKERGGLPAWQTLDGVGMNAISDGILLWTSSHYLVDKYFRVKDYYARLVSTMTLAEHKTIIGMCLENSVANQNVLDFSEETLLEIYQTKVYWFYSMVSSAMCMTGWRNPADFKKASDLTTEIGCLIQARDDFHDVYGDPSQTGKIGTDIQCNRHTWFAIAANRLATDQQRNTLKENYGYEDPEKVAAVKQLYGDLNLHDLYIKYEKERRQMIIERIESSSLGRLESVLQQVLLQMLKSYSFSVLDIFPLVVARVFKNHKVFPI